MNTKMTPKDTADRVGGSQTSVDDVLKILEQEGITDLRQFLKSQLAQREASRHAAAGRADLLGPSLTRSAAVPSAKAQRPITVPVQIDGVLYDPGDIHRFDGQILHFVAPSGTRPFQAYTGDQWPTMLRTYIQVRNVERNLHPFQDASGVQGAGHHPHFRQQTSPTAVFYSDIQFEGDHLWLSEGFEWSDLTKVGRGDFWNRQSWNDCISSVAPQQGFGALVLCEDIHLGGASLSIPAEARDLRLYGWNDRASSLVYW
jgi:hypothetical protein